MKIPKIRIPVPRPGHAIRSKKEYSRNSIKVTEEDLCGGCDECLGGCPVRRIYETSQI